MRLLIDDKIPFIHGQAERLGTVRYMPGAAISRDDAMQADVLIVRTRTRCDAALLNGTPVRFIATATIGYDHLDRDYLSRAGIGWANCPGCNATSVAQYVATALLPLIDSGRLPARPTVGIVGVGHVGTAVALHLRQMGFPLLLCDPPRRERARHGTPCAAPHTAIADDACTATMEQLAAEADVITFHVPLTDGGPYATRHLADARFFAALQRRPVVINAARGEVADNTAWVEALDRHLTGPAIVDTWENEPHILPALLRRAYIATPHIAGYSADGKARGTQMALEAVARHMGCAETFAIAPPPLPDGFRYWQGTPEADLLRHPALRRYDPRRDSEALKTCPEAFERLRGDYPLRRE